MLNPKMSSITDLFTPLVGELGIGGIGGFLVGFAVKKAAKIIALIIGLFFLSLQYLAYRNIISINYGALRVFAGELLGQTAGVQTWVADFLAHAPFGAAFIGGLYLGLQKG
jgi:uncharacterized membrane protein (Fun14 family)